MCSPEAAPERRYRQQVLGRTEDFLYQLGNAPSGDDTQNLSMFSTAARCNNDNSYVLGSVGTNPPGGNPASGNTPIPGSMPPAREREKIRGSKLILGKVESI